MLITGMMKMTLPRAASETVWTRNLPNNVLCSEFDLLATQTPMGDQHDTVHRTLLDRLPQFFFVRQSRPVDGSLRQSLVEHCAEIAHVGVPDIHRATCITIHCALDGAHYIADSIGQGWCG